MNLKRVRKLNNYSFGKGPVVCWLSRDQRIKDNWALIYSQQLALEMKTPLIVVFCLAPSFNGATDRQFGFLLRGLQELEVDLINKNIQFEFLRGNPEIEIPKYVKSNKISVIVSDFSPLKIVRKWRDGVSKKIGVSFLEVDSHNIVPVWIASPKQEFGAYTFRPKIHKLLPEFLEEYPTIKKHPFGKILQKESIKNIDDELKNLKIDHKVNEVSWVNPGEKAGQKMLKEFIVKGIQQYDADRNDPTKDAQSHLSPFLHFGMLSSQRIALEISQMPHSESKDAFLEELIVRKELSDNFCFYNQNYDTFDGFPDWGKKNLKLHWDDTREFSYTVKEFEAGKTHDELWNAAQNEMVYTGKMHGYMRMYWAKKILEWSENPDQALKVAIYLNDKYELDGRDPNGYTGIAWSIGGLHDRAWGEREIFGKVRFMSYNGAKSKFKIAEYIKRVSELTSQTLF